MSSIHDTGVNSLVRACVGLRRLNLRGCYNVGDMLRIVNPDLKDLSLQACSPREYRVIPPMLTTLSACVRAFQSTNVSNDTVGHVLGANDLYKLGLRNCPDVTGITITSHTLRMLDVSVCNITDEGLRTICAGCPSLRSLKCELCRKIIRPVVRSDLLEYLVVSRCVCVPRIGCVKPLQCGWY